MHHLDREDRNNQDVTICFLKPEMIRLVKVVGVRLPVEAMKEKGERKKRNQTVPFSETTPWYN